MISYMHISLESMLVALEYYKYILLFPAAVIEGPIVTVIAGLLVALGYMHWWIALIVIVAGDMVGDALHYAFGRYWFHAPWVHRLITKLGYTEARREQLEQHFKKHPGKTYLLGKVAHGVGGLVLVAAGVARTDFVEFLWWNLLATVPKSGVLLAVGYFLGTSYTKINTYLGYVSIAMLVLAGIAVVAYGFMRKRADAFLDH